MLSKKGLEYLLRITDYFHGHWEDPGWGRRPENQVLILTSVHTLAGGIENAATRRQVQGLVQEAMTKASQEFVKESSKEVTKKDSK
jgi:hypothetical protein